MRFTVAAVTAALVAGASAQYQNATTLYTTEVVTAYTTYCPAATSIVHGNVTYTVTEVRHLSIEGRESVACGCVARDTWKSLHARLDLELDLDLSHKDNQLIIFYNRLPP